MAATLTAQLPNGQTARRQTEKSYNHVVAASKTGAEWTAYAWCSTHETARKRAKDAVREGYAETTIVNVDQSAQELPRPYAASSAQPAGQLVNVAPIVSLKIVRDATVPAPAQVKSPTDVFALLRERFADIDREQFIVVCLDTKNRVLAINVAFVGTLNSCSIALREVFKAAVVVGAAAIIVSHNHPSGDPTPSPEDVMLTREIVSAGKLLDIECLDHLVLGSGRFVSLRERGLGF